MAIGLSGSNGGITAVVKKFNKQHLSVIGLTLLEEMLDIVARQCNQQQPSKRRQTMAVGFSGSNGGIVTAIKKADKGSIGSAENIRRLHNFPMEVSYFLNNVCNLSCKHCYVGTVSADNRLRVAEWQKLFTECMRLGALTFGNVGKEPTLVWGDTLKLLQWFREKKRSSAPRLRYGIVTNGILLNNNRVAELAEADPTYVDISFDGDESAHDYIRGAGNYAKTRQNIAAFPAELTARVFISFTANALNMNTFSALVDDLYKIGVRQFLVSPYVSTEVGANAGYGELKMSDESVVAFAKKLLAGEVIGWDRYEGLRIYLKCDYTTSRGIMSELEGARVINQDELWIDDYGVIFNKYHFGANNIVYFNYIPFDDSFVRSIRFSHDGYVSNCYDMFFDDAIYQKRAIGNVREKPLKDILSRFFNRESAA